MFPALQRSSHVNNSNTIQDFVKFPNGDYKHYWGEPERVMMTTYVLLFAHARKSRDNRC